MAKVWKNQSQYDHKVKAGFKFKDVKEDPEKFGYTEEQVVSKTVPGQAISVSELMARYVKGRPIPEE